MGLPSKTMGENTIFSETRMTQGFLNEAGTNLWEIIWK